MGRWRSVVLLLVVAAGLQAPVSTVAAARDDGSVSAVAVAPLVSGARPTVTGPQDRARYVRRPVLKQHGFADPSVVRYHRGYVGVATGRLAPRSRARSAAGPWHGAGTALTRRPAWAMSRSIWAGDLVKVGSRWVLYFAAPVRGLGDNARCIGVAVARRPTARFRPVGSRPLVCPRAAWTPVARDAMDNRDLTLPQHGVIDAEGFRTGQRRFLLYRTQGTPASIRMVRLTGNGLSTQPGHRSHELVRANDVIENPVLIKRGRGFYLLTSEGYYGDCGYRTTWRRTTTLWDWSRSRSRWLMDGASTGLCGPGGADVVETPGLRSHQARRALLFLHAWTCPGVGVCPAGPDYQGHPTAHRSLYAAWLWWKHGWPRVTSFVIPTRDLPEPPVPTGAVGVPAA